MAKIPTVSTYEVNETLLGGYTVSYKCPHCHSELKSKRSKIGVPTECPKCGNGYGISRKALNDIERIESAKQAEADRRQQEKLDNAPKCRSCGTPLSFLDRIAGPKSERLCDECTNHQKELAEQKANEAREFKERYINSFLVTTTPLLDGYRIVDYLGIDGVEITVGTGIFAEFGAIIKDTVGARSLIMESKLRKARLEAIRLLKILAINRGANAVISIDFDYSTFGQNQFVIIASGTLVRVERTASLKGQEDEEAGSDIFY